MKRLFALLITIYFCSVAVPAHAQSATAAATPSDEKSQQIEDLKDRLATKVAELRQSKRMAAYGTIKSVSISTFVVETKTKDLKIELTDDLKIFQMLKGKRTELKTDNLEKGDIVTVFGEYDTTLELLQAKMVFIQSAQPLQIAGKVTTTDKEDYTITIETADNKTYTVDFETTTKTNLWNGTTLEKGGFSSFGAGDIIFVTGTAVAKKENRISATRITDIPSQVRGATTTSNAATQSATPKATSKVTPTP
ncbi:MAG: hypothetical protein WAV51_01370 [Microgenomates group bacterium]